MAIVKITPGIKGNVKQRIAKITLNLDHINNGYVATGWDRNEKYPDGTSVARVALWNEFGSHNADGSVHSPARPFMRPAYNKNKGAIMALQITTIRDLLAAKITPEKALNILGYRMWNYVRAAILANPPPPNAPRTTARKRRAGRPAVTLIDTRRMLDTLSYKIFLGGRNRPPMKEDAGNGTGGGSSGGGGGVKVRPQNHPRANEHPAPGAIAKIPHVRTPDEIRREKKELQDELRRAKRDAKKPAGPGPGGKPRKVRVKVGGGNKAVGPKTPKPPKALKPPKAPGGPKTPRPTKATPGAKTPKQPRLPAGKKPGTKHSPGHPSKPRTQKPKVVRPDRTKTRPKKDDERRKTKGERHTRSKTAAARRGPGILSALESALLRGIIALARGASRYGRSL